MVRDLLYVVIGVAIFAAFMFGILTFSMRWAYARVRFEKVKREMKEQGKYEAWAKANRLLLALKTIVNTGLISGLPGFLLCYWLGYRQISMVFLGIFVICLLARVPLNRILYQKIHQDPK